MGRDEDRVPSEDGFELTVHGLLRKRRERLGDLAELRAEEKSLEADVAALDRALWVLGYEKELDAPGRHQARVVLFYRNELRRWLKSELKVHGPSTNRQMAERLIAQERQDARDARMMNDLVKRIGKSLRSLQKAGIVKKRRQGSGWLWSLTKEAYAPPVPAPEAAVAIAAPVGPSKILERTDD